MKRSTLWLASVVATTLVLAAATPSLAAFPGQNGKILFVSGVGGPAGDDTGADLYVLDHPGATGVPVDTRSGQHRHPAWAPNLKRVAYALWDSSNNEKVWVQDLATNSVDRLGLSESSVRDDRPQWSPDGTKIAYESEVTDGSGQMDILIADVSTFVTGAPTVNLTDSPGFIEGRPVWSPDGKTIYYSRRALASMDDDILKEASDNSDAIPSFVVNSATAEYQAELSPDGTKMCYTRGAFGSSVADVYVGAANGGGTPFDLSDTSLGAYNCAWSPDGQFITYALGTFTGASLVYEPSDDSGTPALMTVDTASHFDGNPDWAPRHPALCEGKPATIVGTDARDVLHGTSHRDVIASFGGNDSVSGAKGNDLLCGGKGSDHLQGDDGNDRLDGGKGVDTCVGGPGTDARVACEH